jgi:hypothetical protein
MTWQRPFRWLLRVAGHALHGSRRLVALPFDRWNRAVRVDAWAKALHRRAKAEGGTVHIAGHNAVTMFPDTYHDRLIVAWSFCDRKGHDSILKTASFDTPQAAYAALEAWRVFYLHPARRVPWWRGKPYSF